MDPADAALESFRRRVRRWIEANAPSRGWVHGSVEANDGPDARLARAQECQRMLFDAGLAGITWPTQYGGQGLSNREALVFNQEAAAYDLPITPFVIGLGMCGPTILAHGDDLQKERYLRPMLRGEEIWCQLFSEPDAGSDLAAVRTAAVADGERWLLTGQKVWTSGAHHSRFGMILARTDATVPKHQGLTMFVIDMASPGIAVRPLRQMNGEARFNEVFLDDVPAQHVLGVVGAGWTTALTTLMNERVSIGTGPSNYGHAFEVVAAAAPTDSGAVVVDSLAGMYIEEKILQLLRKRTTDAILAGRQPGPEGSVAKLAGTAAAKRAASLAIDLVGPAAVAHRGGDEAAAVWADVLCTAPGLSIAGGTDEILRNVIGERVLGLPKAPRETGRG